jgi:hypothetical protein
MWLTILSRARFLSSERTRCHGAQGVSVAARMPDNVSTRHVSVESVLPPFNLPTKIASANVPKMATTP